MKNTIRKAIALCAVSVLLFLSACSGTAPKEITTTAFPEKTDPVGETTENIARTVEIPYENDYAATFTFNEKGLLVSSENCPWGDDNDYYKYDEHNRIIEIQHALWDGTVDDGCERNIYQYDKSGNLQTVTTYRGSKEKLVRHRVYEFEYDTDGKLIKKTTKSGINNQIMENVENEYDANGSLIKSVCNSYGEISETFYEYAPNGKISLMNEIDRNGKSHKTTYEYDAEGTLIKESSEDFTSNYKYENGLLIKETTENWYIEYKYFDNNRIIAAYFYGNDGIEEISIRAVPEVMGNYSQITVAPLP